MVTQAPDHFQKWEWMELSLLYIFCCSGHFSRWKCIFLGRNEFDVLYTWRAKRCNVPSSAVLLIKKNTMFFFLYKNVTSLGWNWILPAIYCLLTFSFFFFFFLMETILFLYSLGTQHSAELPSTRCAIGVVCSYSNLVHMLFALCQHHIG